MCKCEEISSCRASGVTARPVATVVVNGMRWLRSAYEQTIADNNKLLDGDEVIEFLNSYFGGVPSYFAELFERVQDPSRHLDELVVPQGKYADLPRRSRRRNRETIPLVEKSLTSRHRDSRDRRRVRQRRRQRPRHSSTLSLCKRRL